MNYAFENLVSVNFYHSYFSGETFNGFTVEPSAETVRSLLNLGMLFKPFNGGFRILYDTAFAGSSRTRRQVLSENITCSFILRLNDPAFYNYTSPFGGDISRSMFHFHNFPRPGSERKGFLHQDNEVSPADLFALSHFGKEYFVKPFARLDLQVNEEIEPAYSIRFKAKETYWRYILVSGYLNELNNPAILDSANSEAFHGPEKLPLSGKEILAFRSKTPLSFSQDNRNVFQLVDQYEAGSGRYKVVVRALPVADPNHITLVGTGGDTKEHINYSEIFIH
jgi:hypothetical protein